MDAPEWAEAEDAFLEEVGAFRPWPHGRWYVAPDIRNRRANALRVTDPAELDRIDWTATWAEARALWGPHQMPVTLQLPEPLTPDGLPGDWRMVGPVFVHVATDVADFCTASDRLVELRDVSGDDELTAFTAMMVDNRVPEQRRAYTRGILRERFAAALEGPSRYLLAWDGDELVGQVAAMAAPAGYALNHLTVPPEHRGRGFMKAIYATLARELSGRAYGQIIEGVATLAFRDRFPSTVHLARTRTYQRMDDPFCELVAGPLQVPTGR